MSKPARQAALAVTIVAAAMLVAACSEPRAGAAPASALAVTTAPVVLRDAYAASREYSGRVEAARESALGFEVPGQLARVSVEEGDRVRAGDALAMLDTARLRAGMQQAEARLSEARAQADLAAATLQRVTAARAFDGVSAQEVDQAEEAASRAAAAASAAEAALDAIRIDIDKSTLRAPYDAWVIRRLADEGQVMAAGVPVLDIQESAELEVRIGVAGELLDGIAVGQQKALDINGMRVPAQVSAIIPRRNTRTRSVDVLFRLDAAAPARVGDIARLTVEQEIPKPGFWLPLDALAEGDRGVWTAYAVAPLDDAPADAARATGATHRLEARPLEVLHEEADRVYARGALADGELIVSTGMQRVVTGQLVRLAAERTEIAARQVSGHD